MTGAAQALLKRAFSNLQMWKCLILTGILCVGTSCSGTKSSRVESEVYLGIATKHLTNEVNVDQTLVEDGHIRHAVIVEFSGGVMQGGATVLIEKESKRVLSVSY